MKTCFWAAAVLSIIFSPCLRAEDIVSVKSETYFGECVGYCQTTLVITKQNIIYTESTWNKSDPKKSVRMITSNEEWKLLSQNAPLKHFFPLPTIIGDPDDADQGGEILEIRTDRRTKKTSFDYGLNVSGMEDYLQIVRNLRKEMQLKLRPSAH